MKGACPKCGATDRLSTIENVEAYLPVEFEIDEFGAAEAEFTSDRDVEYGDSYDSSIGIQCGCGWEDRSNSYTSQLIFDDGTQQEVRYIDAGRQG